MTARIFTSTGGGSSAIGPHHGDTNNASPSAFVEALNTMHHGRRRRPDAARSTTAGQHHRRPRRASGPSYDKAARLQPRMWTGSGGQATAPPPQTAKRTIVRKRCCAKISNSSSGSQSPVVRLNNDKGDEASTPLEEPEAPDAAVEPVAKRPRRVSQGTTSSFLSSDLLRRRYGGGARPAAPRSKTTVGVAFAYPLVTEERTRPRTPPADKATLFYNRADEKRFRREERLRRRRVAQNAASKKKARGEEDDDPNEITESDSSNEGVDNFDEDSEL